MQWHICRALHLLWIPSGTLTRRLASRAAHLLQVCTRLPRRCCIKAAKSRDDRNSIPRTDVPHGLTDKKAIHLLSAKQACVRIVLPGEKWVDDNNFVCSY